MSKSPRAKGLGRGLSALMADIQPVDGGGGTSPDRLLPVDRIDRNPDQPRRQFSEEALEDLANSIREKGVIQPLIVRIAPSNIDRYQIVAGERRWRAAQLAGLSDVPVVVRNFDDGEVLEIAIVENVQRTDLNPVEEAAGYRQLMERFGHTQERLAEVVGKSRSHIANVIRLLQLPPDVLDLVSEGALSAGHARALITHEDASELAQRVVEKGLSVRETEQLTKRPRKKKAGEKPISDAKDEEFAALEADMSAALGIKVKIEHRGAGRGRLILQYTNEAQLNDLCNLLGQE